MKRLLIGLMVALLMVTASAPATAMGNPASEGMTQLLHSFHAIFAPAPEARQRQPKVNTGGGCQGRYDSCIQGAMNNRTICQAQRGLCYWMDTCDCPTRYQNAANDCWDSFQDCGALVF